jgi:hypothetical protein
MISMASLKSPRLRLIDSVAAELVWLVATPHAEIDTPVAHQVEEGKLLGDANGVVEGEHDDPCSPPPGFE